MSYVVPRHGRTADYLTGHMAKHLELITQDIALNANMMITMSFVWNLYTHPTYGVPRTDHESITNRTPPSYALYDT